MQLMSRFKRQLQALTMCNVKDRGHAALLDPELASSDSVALLPDPCSCMPRRADLTRRQRVTSQIPQDLWQRLLCSGDIRAGFDSHRLRDVLSREECQRARFKLLQPREQSLRLGLAIQIG